MSTSERATAELIENLADHVARYYVFPERAGDLASVVRAEAPAVSVDDLADRLTVRLRQLTNDFHFRFEVRTFSAAERGAEPQHRWKQTPPDPRMNHGFKSVVADSRVGTITITPFLVPPRWSADTAHAAFRFIRTTRSVIIDLRDCFGGDPHLIAIIASYFLGPGKTPLNSARWRDTGETEALFASSDLVPFQFDAEVDLQLVVGPQTASGGEALAYDLQALGRATVVGSPTLGVAHRIKQFQVGSIVATIPCGLVTNPITQADWEDGSVNPDVIVEVGDALSVARQHAQAHATRP